MILKLYILILKKSPNKRNQLLNKCLKYLKNKKKIAEEDTRIAIIKILIALLPESIQVIKTLINNKSSLIDYEIHFTLFCFVSNIFYIKIEKKIVNEILLLIRDYLINAKYDKAMAVWMVGDLLGDHWKNLNEALNTLLDILKYSKYSEGKKSALHGIEYLYPKMNTERRNIIKNFLKQIRNKEKNETVTILINNFLKSARKKQK